MLASAVLAFCRSVPQRLRAVLQNARTADYDAAVVSVLWGRGASRREVPGRTSQTGRSITWRLMRKARIRCCSIGAIHVSAAAAINGTAVSGKGGRPACVRVSCCRSLWRRGSSPAEAKQVMRADYDDDDKDEEHSIASEKERAMPRAMPRA